MIDLNPICLNHNHYVSINGYESGLAALSCGIPQGSVVGPLLFLPYIAKFTTMLMTLIFYV